MRDLHTVTFKQENQVSTPGVSFTKPRHRRTVTGFGQPEVRSVQQLGEEPIAFGLEPVIDREESMIRVARPFGASTVPILSLEPLHMDRTLTAELKEYMDMTYVPSECGWVRLGWRITGKKVQESFFVRRADAQRLAYSLLSLKWHPESYLIGGANSHRAIQLLLNSQRMLAYITMRVKDAIDLLSISATERKQLAEALDLGRRYINSHRPSRSLYDAIYKLDKVLGDLAHQKEEVNAMVSVLMLTNEEFATLLHSSARHFESALKGSIECNMRAGSLKVPLPFGGSQEFVVDLDKIFPERMVAEEQVLVQYSTILLVCLRACLRAFMLDITLSGEPLLEELSQMEELVYVR